MFFKLVLFVVFVAATCVEAELIPGNEALPIPVYSAISAKIQAECPSMYARESMGITDSTFDYHGNEVFEYTINLIGRGYAVNDPHWDMNFVVHYDQHLDEVLSLEMHNRGDCW